ncbi:MAG TPA: hypothetical protein VII92_02300 [Anaerolineae bacterium]
MTTKEPAAIPSLREKFEAYADENGIPIPTDYNANGEGCGWFACFAAGANSTAQSAPSPILSDDRILEIVADNVGCSQDSDEQGYINRARAITIGRAVEADLLVALASVPGQSEPVAIVRVFHNTADGDVIDIATTGAQHDRLLGMDGAELFLRQPAPASEAVGAPIGFISDGAIKHALAQGHGVSTYIQAGRPTSEFPVAIYIAPAAPTDAPSVEDAIAALVTALSASKGWMRDYADAIVRDAIDRKADAPDLGVRDKALEEAANAFDPESMLAITEAQAQRRVRALRSRPVSVAHPDDIAVDMFAIAMKVKMAKQRAKGYGGWDDPADCTVESLAYKLMEHAKKGDPADVANFAMMLHKRGAEREVLIIAALDFARRIASAFVPEPVAVAPKGDQQ